MNGDVTLEEIVGWLRTPASERERLYQRADETRRAHMGDAVPLRGIIEFSNLCANDCLYCGLRRSNVGLRRYTIAPDEILDIARPMAGWGQMTVVLQSGEAPSPSGDRALGELIVRLKRETPLAVTVSVGNRPRDVYAYWRACGMDRYLLRFETSAPDLYRRLHGGSLDERLACLESLRGLGVQIGSGFMIGLPGETHERLAENILQCRRLDLDMIGIGPYIPNPATPMGREPNAWASDPDMFFVALAALRLANPDAHIPATTAFGVVFPRRGRELALRRGANVFMPNSTPGRYRRDYQLYPDKPGVDEEADECAARVAQWLHALGRDVARGPGDSLRRGSA
jgi:biotin synthase